MQFVEWNTRWRCFPPFRLQVLTRTRKKTCGRETGGLLPRAVRVPHVWHVRLTSAPPPPPRVVFIVLMLDHARQDLPAVCHARWLVKADVHFANHAAMLATFVFSWQFLLAAVDDFAPGIVGVERQQYGTTTGFFTQCLHVEQHIRTWRTETAESEAKSENDPPTPPPPNMPWSNESEFLGCQALRLA